MSSKSVVLKALVFAAFILTLSGLDRVIAAEAPYSKWKWKSVCDWGGVPHGTDKEVKNLISTVKKLGFNVFIMEEKLDEKSQERIIKEGKAQGVDIFVLINMEFQGRPKACAQVLSAEDKERLKAQKKKKNYPYQFGGEPVEKGEVFENKMLCFHKKEAEEFFFEKIKKYAGTQGVKGLCLDYIGYQNYYACFCETSIAVGQEYAKAHPEMAKEQALLKFSEESLINFINRSAAYAKQINPDIKTSLHVYPVFVPNPLYGNKLNIDYVGQTVSWFFLPHWTLEKVKKMIDIVVKDGKKYYPTSMGVPMFGLNSDKNKKTPERMAEEFKILKEAGAEGVLFANLQDMLMDEEMCKVIAKELNGSW